jgi:predicted aspartyl protease
MVVNNQEQVETIIDPGSQIIAMADSVCHELGLIYDPTIQLNMQSANGEINRSLGLAHNIPC